VETGRAAYILDALIDSGKAVPMIVVMPLGYGNWTFLTNGFSSWGRADAVSENTALFSDELEHEVMPAVEHEYHIAAGRQNHAIAGLSMGGLESLYIGLNHTQQFAYIGGFSAAIQEGKFDAMTPKLDAKTADLKLLWMACGVDDRLNAPKRAFVEWAKLKGLPVTSVETPGRHEWPVWRDNLLHFVPLLFR
jgi:enterochelin esterase family protein